MRICDGWLCVHQVLDKKGRLCCRRCTCDSASQAVVVVAESFDVVVAVIVIAIVKMMILVVEIESC